jgi:hypothetical protein
MLAFLDFRIAPTPERVQAMGLPSLCHRIIILLFYLYHEE